MTKKILLHILLSTLLGILLMVIGMFIAMETDITQWSESRRATLAWLWMMATICMIMPIWVFS